MKIEKIQVLSQEITLFKKLLLEVNPGLDQTFHGIFENEKANFINYFKKAQLEVSQETKEQESINSSDTSTKNTKICPILESRSNKDINVLIESKNKDFQNYLKNWLPKDLPYLHDLNQVNLSHPLVVFKLYCERLFEDSFIKKVNQMKSDKIFIAALKAPNFTGRDELHTLIGKKHADVYIFNLDLTLKHQPRRKDNITFLSILEQAGYTSPMNYQLKCEKESRFQKENIRPSIAKQNSSTNSQDHSESEVKQPLKSSRFWGLFS